MRIPVFVDGACKGDKVGGWGVNIDYPDREPEHLFGGEVDTTNNRMELEAAIQALKHLPNELSLDIYSDSNYVVQGITSWIHGWKRNQFIGVKNRELWILLDALRRNRDINWNWIKAHAGHEGNEMADKLANRGVKLTRQSLENGQ